MKACSEEIYKKTLAKNLLLFKSYWEARSLNELVMDTDTELVLGGVWVEVVRDLGVRRAEALAWHRGQRHHLYTTRIE